MWQTRGARQPDLPQMNGMTIDELRAAGTTVRHQHGINTCARCHKHFLQSEAEQCCIHTAEIGLIKAGEEDAAPTEGYPCCQKARGSAGCTPAPHLPLFQTIDGKIQSHRRIEYDAATNLHVGRWVSTRMSIQQLNKEAAGAGSSPAQATASSSSSAAAPGGPASPLSAPAVASSSIPRSIPHMPGAVGAPVPRTGDEIMVCGQLYHTGTPVILWGDVGGYDHYRVERRFCPFEEADWATTQKELPNFTTPNRFGLRKNGLTPAEIEAVRGGQWDLPTLQKQMKSFVLHYDELGISQQCFRMLQDVRDLSIHFMCDLDGTIYQSLDLKERAWQATIANTTSVGCEIANIGAYDPTQPTPFSTWYAKNAQGQTIITIDPNLYPNNGGIHTPGFVGSPARPDPIAGVIQGQNLIQYDYTPQQYASLTKLIAAFCTIFPAIPATYPKDSSGQLIRQKLPDAELATYTGLLGHYHIQTDKIDPGPAMQWDVVTSQAQAIMEQTKREVEAKRKQDAVSAAAPAAAMVPASASSSSFYSVPSAAAVSDNSAKIPEWNMLRKLERKLLQSADEAASRHCRDSDAFYLVDAKWWARWKCWLSCTDAAVARPGPVSNLRLLSTEDERSPRAGLMFPRDYRAVHERVWKEIVELYETDATIVRASTDIYGLKPGEAVASAASSSSSASAFSAPRLAAPSAAASSSSSSSQFVVPVISTEADDTWIIVQKRVPA